MSRKKLRVNEQIRATKIRLINEKGDQVGVVPLEEGFKLAEQAGLDLVEVAPEADPSVCKVLDFGKYKYRLKKRKHQTKHSHGSEVKEIRLHPKTGQHDVDYRITHAREFIEDGYRVQVNVLFKGREMVHTELGRELINRFADELKDVAKVEQSIKMEGRRMMAMLSPK